MNGIERDDPVSQEFTVLFVSHNSQRRRFWKQDLGATKTATDVLGQTASAFLSCTVFFATHTHLFKNKWLLVPHRVDGVGCGGPLGAVFLLGVTREPDHLHLNASFHVFVGQELA